MCHIRPAARTHNSLNEVPPLHAQRARRLVSGTLMGEVKTNKLFQEYTGTGCSFRDEITLKITIKCGHIHKQPNKGIK